MKFSKKLEQMEHSPIRKFYKYAAEAERKGKKIFYLNIGQPDIKTPKVFFDAVKHFDEEVLAYMPSQGIPELIEAMRKYYEQHKIYYDSEDITITQGGSEALTFTMLCITNDGDEIIVPEPFYTNYNIFIKISESEKQNAIFIIFFNFLILLHHGCQYHFNTSLYPQLYQTD